MFNSENQHFSYEKHFFLCNLEQILSFEININQQVLLCLIFWTEFSVKRKSRFVANDVRPEEQ